MATKYEFLDQSGVQQLAKVLLNTVNIRIKERIVDTIDAKSDDKHVPSAAAVYKAITSRNHVGIKTITGNIDEQVPQGERSTSMIYLQRDDAQDKTWAIYIWNADPEVDFDFDGEWICIGDTEVDLENYWSKDDVEAMKEALGINDLQPSEDLTEVKEDVSTLKTDVSGLKSDVEGLQTEVEKKVNAEDLTSISSEDLTAILEQVKKETDVMSEGHIDADDPPDFSFDDVDSPDDVVGIEDQF